MTQTRSRIARLFAWSMSAAFVTAVLSAAGCHHHNNGGTGTNATVYEGAMTGAGSTNGTVSFSVQPVIGMQGDVLPMGAQNTNVSGTLKLNGGSTVELTGSFDSPTGPLTATGGGYTFTGTISNDVLSGTWTGPTGNGSFVAVNAASGTIAIFCGSFTGTSSGSWDLIQSGSTTVGTFTPTGGTSSTITGTMSGNSLNLTLTSGGTATGTITGSTVSGTWANGSSSGSFTGSTSNCH